MNKMTSRQVAAAMVWLLDEASHIGKEAAKKAGHPVDAWEILEEVASEYDPNFASACHGCSNLTPLTIDEEGDFISGETE